jgi:hypothetical protein
VDGLVVLLRTEPSITTMWGANPHPLFQKILTYKKFFDIIYISNESNKNFQKILKVFDFNKNF